MEKTDARKLKPEVQQQLRNQATRLFKKNWKNAKIAEALGVSHVTVGRWRSTYTENGSKGLKLEKRGRRKGALRTLSPDQLKLPFALWTRKAIQQLIFELWSIDMPIRTVGEYLMRWNFTPQKPLKRAYEQNPKAVKQWLEKDYPDIAAKAKTEKAEIHWGDETGLVNNSQHGRSYSLRGKTPVLRLPAKKERINLISSVTNQGKTRFMLYDGTMNSDTFIKFMKRLIKDAGKKIYLILDNLRVHHSKPVKDWVKEHHDQIELFFLPSYSPELNPDEYLNCDLKDGVHSKVPSRSKKDLKRKTISHLRKIQKSSKRVKNYFKHPKIAYAA